MAKLHVVIALLSAVCALAGVEPNTYRQCGASGDPHFWTFDGACHDFQGAGSYVLLKNNKYQMHYDTMRCNWGAAAPVTCVRAVSVHIQEPGTSGPGGPVGSRDPFPLYLKVKWGSFGTERVYATNVVDPVLIETNIELPWPSSCTSPSSNPRLHSCPIDAFKTQLDVNLKQSDKGAKWSVRLVNSELNVWRNDATVSTALHDRFKWGWYYFFVGLRHTSDLGQTNGLCGYWDNSVQNEYLAENLTAIFPGASCSASRAAAKPLHVWGYTWSVSATGNHKPIFSSFHHRDLMGNHIMSDDVPNATVPTNDELAGIDKLDLDLDRFKEAEKFCTSINKNKDREAYINCMYDLTATKDNALFGFPMAASNQVASENIQLSVAAVEADQAANSSALSGGAIAAIVVGTVAGVILIVIGALVIHLRRARKQLSQALVLARGSGPQGSSAALMDNL